MPFGSYCSLTTIFQKHYQAYWHWWKAFQHADCASSHCTQHCWSIHVAAAVAVSLDNWAPLLSMAIIIACTRCCCHVQSLSLLAVHVHTVYSEIQVGLWTRSLPVTYALLHYHLLRAARSCHSLPTPHSLIVSVRLTAIQFGLSKYYKCVKMKLWTILSTMVWHDNDTIIYPSIQLV